MKGSSHADPNAIFRHAEAFYGALDQLHRTSTPQQARAIMLPLAVLSAFLSEIYLKCLVCLEIRKVPQTHYLHDLFLQLSPETRAVIEQRWDAIMIERAEILVRLDEQMDTPVPRDLETNLKEGNNAFLQLRYVYEGGKDFRFLLSDLPIALRQTVEVIKPDWFGR